jgi:uncharacterized protein YegL
MKQHVIVLIDISYSMKKNSSAIIKGLNLFLERLQKVKNANDIYLSVVLFCHKINYLCKAVMVKEVHLFSIKQLPQFGFTYLYDAIGHIIKEWIHEKMVEHNFFIITDGHDTGSMLVSESESRELCDNAIKNGWRITHCGVDAGNLGAGVSEIPSDLNDLESLLSCLCI